MNSYDKLFIQSCYEKNDEHVRLNVYNLKHFVSKYKQI